MAQYLNLAGVEALWAKVKNTFALKSHTHSYLPLSGGTVSGQITINADNTYPLIINGTETLSTIHIKAGGTHKVDIGWLNQEGRGDNFYIANVSSPSLLNINNSGIYYSNTAAGFSNYKIIHEGNYADTTDNRYLKLSGGTIDGTLTIQASSPAITFKKSNTSNPFASLGIYSDKLAMYVNSENKYYDIIHSGNIGSQSVYKADRAEKLVYSDGTIGLQVLSGGVIKPSNRIAFDSNTTGICRGSYYTGALSDSDIVIAAPKMVFHEGSVLIGTTTESGAKLHIWGTTLFNQYNALGNAAGAAILINKGGDYFGIGASTSHISNISFGLASIEGTWGSEFLTITNNGNVGIGTTNPTSKLQVDGNISASGFYQDSDERLKTFHDPIKVDLEKLKTLRKNYFKFNDKDKLEIGVSAQEIQEIYPELVTSDDKGYLSVAYDKLSVIALSAIDELHEENKQLKSENDELRSRIEAIENILNKLTINQ